MLTARGEDTDKLIGKSPLTTVLPAGKNRLRFTTESGKSVTHDIEIISRDDTAFVFELE
jgi:hypothetical protein